MTAAGGRPARYELATSVKRFGGMGEVLVGGAPRRVIRLTKSGVELLEALVNLDSATGRRPSSEAEMALTGRLIDAAIIERRLEPRSGNFDATVVIPICGTAKQLLGPLAAASQAGCPALVVDDGCPDALGIAEVVESEGATVIRKATATSPAAARNRGWRSVDTEFVVFIDAEVSASTGWAARCAPHFDDPAVAAVAGRVQSEPSDSIIGRYESVRSPLDMGAQPALVGPGTKVPYVPSAFLAIRRSALLEHAGFDESLRFGEDVDLIWRLVRSGARVEYDPSISLLHPPRPSLRSWLRQRFDYGSSAATLAERHGALVAPLRVSGTSALLLAAQVINPPTGALATAAAVLWSSARLKRRFGLPWRASLELAVVGRGSSVAHFLNALRRSWLPIGSVGALRSRRLRWLMAIVAFSPVCERRGGTSKQENPLGFAVWLALRAIDDAAYCTGVWAGGIKLRSARALWPEWLRASRRGTSSG